MRRMQTARADRLPRRAEVHPTRRLVGQDAHDRCDKRRGSQASSGRSTSQSATPLRPRLLNARTWSTHKPTTRPAPSRRRDVHGINRRDNRHPESRIRRNLPTHDHREKRLRHHKPGTHNHRPLGTTPPVRTMYHRSRSVLYSKRQRTARARAGGAPGSAGQSASVGGTEADCDAEVPRGARATRAEPALESRGS